MSDNQKMATEKEVTTGFAVTGSIAAASLVISIAAVATAAVNRNMVNSNEDRITTLEATVPTLVNDAANVPGAESIVGDPVVTDALTILPKLHLKGLIAGPGIDVAPGTNVVTISNIQEITLEAAAATEPDPVSVVADSSTANFPQVRNLIAGTGITLTLSGNDIIIGLV